VQRPRSLSMPAKATDPFPLAVEALTRALLDPSPKVLLGSKAAPGFFQSSSASTRAAAKLCEDRGWVSGTGEWAGSGKSKKQKYRLTPAGVRAILEHGETLTVVRSLAGALQEQVDQYRSMRDRLGLLADQIQPLTEVVNRLLDKVQPPDVEAILQKLDRPLTPPPAPVRETAPAVAGWLDEVVGLVAEQARRDRLQPLTLPQIFSAIRKRSPEITLGQFHDGLRKLHDQRRVRLTPYTRALATLGDPRNAVFLNGEVMYYAENP
jgi:hypothetical protein